MSWSIPQAFFRRHAALAAALHLGAAALAYGAAFGLRFDFALPPDEAQRLVRTLPLLLLARAAAVQGLGVHRGSWRHVGVRDLGRLLAAATAGSGAFVLLLAAVGALGNMPRSVLLIDWLAFLLLAGGMRVAVRGARENAFRRPTRGGRRVLVIGAGRAAERFVRQMQHDGRADLAIVGLLDDAPHTHGLALHGVPVLGGVDALADVVRRKRADLVVIATPSATGEQMRRLVTCCADTRLEYRTVPSARELIDAQGTDLPPLREVRLEDLLGRAPVHLAVGRVSGDLARKTVLVTGGAGSIGAELARQIARFGPARLVIFERAESPLYFVHLELAAAYPDIDVVAAIGDVTDAARLDDVCARYRPDYVFHAAAYKHVPLCEAHVREAVRNNVLGTYHVADCAARHGVHRMVFVSTDKAVNPSSVMGATKRLAEQVVLNWPTFRAASTDYRVVRFGNVLGSDGSVIPLFRRQLAAGGPLTVTHPGMTRYFMSIPEAVQLVLQAAALPQAAGRVSMLEMGEPVRIVDLAEQLIRLSGRVPHRDVQIVFTGLRPGEKLTEELVGATEVTVPTALDKVRLVDTAAVSAVALESRVDALFAALACGDEAATHAALCAAVPEYTTLVPGRAQLPREAAPAGTEVSVANPSAPFALPTRTRGGPLLPTPTPTIAGAA